MVRRGICGVASLDSRSFSESSFSPSAFDFGGITPPTVVIDKHDGWRKIKQKPKKHQAKEDKEDIQRIVREALYGPPAQIPLQKEEKSYTALNSVVFKQQSAIKQQIDDDEEALILLLLQ